MTEIKDSYFPSSSGENQIFLRQWLPEAAPRAVLQLSHGVDEHILRYDGFARFLNDQGILVVGNDHLGHGRSVREEADFLWFSERDGWRHAVDDLHQVYLQTRAAYPDKPYFLMGHSMGSFLARTYLIRYPGGLSGAILSGTNQMPGLMQAAGRALARGDIRRHGTKNRSKCINALAFGAYNKRFAPNRTAADWLSRDEAAVDKHNADPLCNRDITSGLFYEMLGGLRWIKDPRNLRKMDLDMPVYFFAGDADPVGRQGKGVRQAYQSFRKAGCREVTLKLYPGGRHEMLQETNKAEVYGDILAWLNRQIEK